VLFFLAAAAAAENETVTGYAGKQNNTGVPNTTNLTALLIPAPPSAVDKDGSGSFAHVFGLGLVAVALIALVAFIVIVRQRRKVRRTAQAHSYAVDFPIYGRIFVDDTDYPFSSRNADESDADIFTDDEDEDSFNPDRFINGQDRGNLMEPFLIGDLENPLDVAQGRGSSPDDFDYSHIYI
jgi:hypothetical protein